MKSSRHFQVSNLESSMGEARTRSAVELLGRAPVLAGDAGLNAAAATVSNLHCSAAAACASALKSEWFAQGCLLF